MKSSLLSTKKYFLSCFILFSVFSLISTQIYAKEKSIYGFSINRLPLKGSGTTTMHYWDGWDDYYPTLSLDLNNPVGYELFAIIPFGKQDASFRGYFTKENQINVLSLGLGIQTKSMKEKKPKPFLGTRLTYTNINGKAGQVPYGNNTGADFMYAPDRTKIYVGTDFKTKITSFGLEGFVGYSLPLGKQFLYLEGGYSTFFRNKDPKVTAGGKDIPGTIYSKSFLESDSVYFKIGLAFGR